ncbi:MAG: rRNA maturation RNase YbeY [Firmicutes bacterium]|nr:rRNA maturation RNase YbeY [Bacillota bacterium]
MPATVVNDQSRLAVTEPLLNLVGKAVEEVLAGQGQPDAQVDVTLVDDEAIHELNRTYRGVDKPTDVLSFALQEEMPEAEEPAVADGPPDLLLGDVIISVPRAVEQAQEYGHSLEREMAFLAAHGTLHLLGFDHGTPSDERDMMQRTEQALAPLGLSWGDQAKP